MEIILLNMISDYIILFVISLMRRSFTCTFQQWGQKSPTQNCLFGPDISAFGHFGRKIDPEYFLNFRCHQVGVIFIFQCDIPISSTHRAVNVITDRTFTKPRRRHMLVKRPILAITVHFVARPKMMWMRHRDAPEAMPNVICLKRRPATSCDF